MGPLLKKAKREAVLIAAPVMMTPAARREIANRQSSSSNCTKQEKLLSLIQLIDLLSDRAGTLSRLAKNGAKDPEMLLMTAHLVVEVAKKIVEAAATNV